jgi:hypothetical protein
MKKKDIKKLEEKGIKVISSSIAILNVFKSPNHHEINEAKKFEFDINTKKYFISPSSKSYKKPDSNIYCSEIELHLFYDVVVKDDIKKLCTCESDFELNKFIVMYILNEIVNIKNIKATKYHFDPKEFIYTFYSEDMKTVVMIEQSKKYHYAHSIYITKTVDINRYF